MSQLDNDVTVVITNKPDSELYAVFGDANFDVNVGESAKIDVGTAINYIRSGQAEIAETVDDSTTAFNDNAVEKTNAFNQNAEDKTAAFDDNYTGKKALIDAEVQTAETAATNASNSATSAYNSATNASNSADLAKQWAIGDPSEPTGYSAKHWAEASASAAATIGNGTITLTQGGVVKGNFTTNQSGDATIDLDAGGSSTMTYNASTKTLTWS